MRQMMIVMASYEQISIKIFGIVCDGGGSNVSFQSMLRDFKSLKGVWLEKDCISFKNPFDQKRLIFLWSCATHNLKALRNNLFRSSKRLINKKRSFGWAHVRGILERDQEQELPRTTLTSACVNLDKYSLMNAGHAKAIFRDETVSALVDHIFDEHKITKTTTAKKISRTKTNSTQKF